MKVTLMTSIFLSTFFTNVTLAACKAPTQPTIPNGTTALESQLESAQVAVKSYMADNADFRACLEREKAALTEEMSENEKIIWTRRYNRSVEDEELVVEIFNTQVKAFKAAH